MIEEGSIITVPSNSGKYLYIGQVVEMYTTTNYIVNLIRVQDYADYSSSHLRSIERVKLATPEQIQWYMLARMKG